jgi:hypothetical protein
VKNGAGKNALDRAREKKHHNVVKLLVRHNLGYGV